MAVYVPQIIDNLTSTSIKDGLSANQGRVLKNEHGDLTELYTQSKDTLVDAINEVKQQEQEIAQALDEINGEVI